ncbi:MAG: hypothetical protein LBF34_04715, partial [Puniceicoccales bacterium]|nr:hypothetical protein [Puniceicoccales bacterium]
MKINHINCCLVCLASVSAMYGSGHDHDRREGMRQVMAVFGDNPQYRNLLRNANLITDEGFYNERASREDYSMAFVDFFRRIRAGEHLSSDVLEYGVLPGQPDINARDRNGFTAWDYVNGLSSSDRKYWLDYFRSLPAGSSSGSSFGWQPARPSGGDRQQPARSSRGGSLLAQVGGSGRVAPEEQRRRDRNLALRTAARNGDLNGVINALR